MTTRAGDQFVLRRYLERPQQPAIVRLRREAWAYETVARAGAPVPEVLAITDEPAVAAMLLSHAEGEHLGNAVLRLGPEEAAGAWRSCGQAFAAAHRASTPEPAGGWTAIGISDPSVSRGGYHYEEALQHLERLAQVRPDLRGAFDGAREAVLAAEPLYSRAPAVLCQWDAHLWQFLVDARSHTWGCTALLDWENADFDDPDFDLAQLDAFRFAPVGPVPAAFFEGYGRAPAQRYRLYRLERAAWIIAAHAEGREWLESSVPPAEQFILTFDPLEYLE